MATHTTVSLYLGSNEEGIRNGELIQARAATRNMNRSEYILFCVLEQIKREDEEARSHASAKAS